MKFRSIPLLFVLPILTSCRGVAISNEDALKVLKNIETNFNEQIPFENFSEIHRTTSQETSLEIRSFFNKSEQYFYTFSIQTSVHPSMSESWTYVKEVNGVKNIYDVSRSISGKIDEGDLPEYKITNQVLYTEAQWEKRETAFISSVFSFYSTAIENSRSFIDNEEISVTFESSDVNSIYVSALQKIEGVETNEIKYEYTFSENKLINQKKEEATTSDQYEWSYGKVEIAYPDVEY